MGGRGASYVALALPAFGGLGYLVAFGAPPLFALVNLGALAVAAGMIGLAPATRSRRVDATTGAIALALLFLPLATGPAVNGIARWVPVGPFALHAGLLAMPSLAVLAARGGRLGLAALLAALLAAWLQPDAATGLALTAASIGIYLAHPDWKSGGVAVVGFLASLSMFVRGELPPSPFVEHVLVEAASVSWFAAVALFAAALGGFLLTAYFAGASPAARYALAGSLAGFFIAAMVSHYPYPLIGYGAASILGFGAGLALARQTSSG